MALFIGISLLVTGCKNSSLPEAFPENQSSRERSLLTDNWRFMKHDSAKEADDLIYDARLEVPGEDFPFVQTTLDDTSWERSIFHMIGLSRGYFLKVGVPVVIPGNSMFVPRKCILLLLVLQQI